MPSERHEIGWDQLQQIERSAREWWSYERYVAVLPRVYGTVLDFACGTGYGTQILSTNPDVDLAIGCDKDVSALALARREFQSLKTRFIEPSSLEGLRPDALVSIETIEHIEDAQHLPHLAERLRIPRILLTFPAIPSKKYNPYHHHDFQPADLVRLFSRWALVSTEVFQHGTCLMEFVADPRHWRCEPQWTD